MTGTSVVTAIVEILVSGISGIATGVGNGLSTLAKSIFFETAAEGGTEGLSVLGVCIISFAAISLGLGLCRWVLNFFTSLGARNR